MIFRFLDAVARGHETALIIGREGTDALSIVIFETMEETTRILYVNTKFTQLFGGTAEALIGEPLENLAANDFENVGYKILMAALERDDGVPVEYQATGRDGRLFWLEVRLDPAAAVVEMTDTGCGIPEADRERVLQPFVQAASSLSRQFGGGGLGLSIAHRICSLHGGTLTLDSVEGQGTTVRISLPR